MQRSSEAISQIAGALARAQAELENPEKALTATIASTFPREETRTFRYASLASGLEIVRKCLTKHEIATVQATAIEPETSLIKLTTTLLHASGEWIASDWPVCPVSETAAPHRMGAALTYARRYALFTLVGIAGEDDLDAPDLPIANTTVEAQSSQLLTPKDPGCQLPAPSPAQRFGRTLQASGRHFRVDRPKPAPISAEASAGLRDQLLAEVGKLDRSTLTAWAHKALPRKNKLSSADALAVEAAFEAVLIQFSQATAAPQATEKPVVSEKLARARTDPPSGEVIVRSKPVRERDRSHLKFVASQPCLVCGRTPSDPHHIKFADTWTVGRKVSDRFTVPICRLHHRELHRRGNERVFWQQQGVDPLPLADALWKRTHLPEVAGTPLDENRQPNANGISLAP